MISGVYQLCCKTHLIDEILYFFFFQGGKNDAKIGILMDICVSMYGVFMRVDFLIAFPAVCESLVWTASACLESASRLG